MNAPSEDSVVYSALTKQIDSVGKLLESKFDDMNRRMGEQNDILKNQAVLRGEYTEKQDAQDRRIEGLEKSRESLDSDRKATQRLVWGAIITAGVAFGWRVVETVAAGGV